MIERYFGINQISQYAENVLKDVIGETERAVKYSTNIKFHNGKTAEIWLPKSVFDNGKLTSKGLILVAEKRLELEGEYNAELII